MNVRNNYSSNPGPPALTCSVKINSKVVLFIPKCTYAPFRDDPVEISLRSLVWIKLDSLGYLRHCLPDYRLIRLKRTSACDGRTGRRTNIQTPDILRYAYAMYMRRAVKTWSCPANTLTLKRCDGSFLNFSTLVIYNVRLNWPKVTRDRELKFLRCPDRTPDAAAAAQKNYSVSHKTTPDILAVTRASQCSRELTRAPRQLALPGPCTVQSINRQSFVCHKNMNR